MLGQEVRSRGTLEDLEASSIGQAGGQCKTAQSRGSGGSAMMSIQGKKRPKCGGDRRVLQG